MKSSYGILQKDFMLYLAPATWMLLVRGEGGLEIMNQGRFDFSTSFSQETGSNGKQSSRIDGMRPKLKELSAGCTLNSNLTPLFFSSVKVQ
jgi:hypothetical protein